jgi:hypothetical protein
MAAMVRAGGKLSVLTAAWLGSASADLAATSA